MPKHRVSKSLSILKQMGGIDNVIKSLRTCSLNGINGDINDIESRKNCFGSNVRDLPLRKSVISHIRDAAKDRMSVLLFFFATLALITGYFT
jgi:hypothetical protein